MTGLRVLANLCSVVPTRVGGSEAYTTRLLAAAADADTGPGDTVSLELAAMAGVRAVHPELGGLRWHESRWSGERRAWRAAVESVWLPRLAAGFDVVHHFGGRLPARRSGVSILTVHDIQPLDHPANFSAAKRRYLGWALPRSVRAADLVTVPSRWVAGRLVDIIGVSPRRVRVVPSTYRLEPRRGAEAPLGAAAPSDVDAPLDGRAFVLYPAATYPHKNHALLLEAHAAAWARHGDTWLVLTGGPGRAHAEVAEQASRTPGVLHLGWVDDSRLASLMHFARAVAFPSRYEGFGLPVLEAMQAGTPVIAADATALPELVDGGATLVDPDDLDAWVDALSEVRSGSATIRQRVERGRVRAADFGPRQVAGRLLEAWQAAAERS